MIEIVAKLELDLILNMAQKRIGPELRMNEVG